MDDSVSAEYPDWTRERKAFFAWCPWKSLLAAIRAYQTSHCSICRMLAVLRHRFWSVVTGADIPLSCWKLGGGLCIPHPNGIVIHPDAEIGPNCFIFQQVTLGTLGSGAPRILGHVDIGAGAKILGAVTVGAHAKIGANAVVLKNVPARATAVGVPARVLRRKVSVAHGV